MSENINNDCELCLMHLVPNFVNTENDNDCDIDIDYAYELEQKDKQIKKLKSLLLGEDSNKNYHQISYTYTNDIKNVNPYVIEIYNTNKSKREYIKIYNFAKK